MKTFADITGAAARKLPRFLFIAQWLVIVTRRKENRGRLGLYVRCARGEWHVVSPIDGGPVVFATRDPSLLFDYVRRTQLGTLVHDADDFRVAAFMEKAS